jgi:hypothetical protein
MKELYRILKSQGIIIVTTPYIGNCPFKVSSFERNYNRQKLKKLIEDFHIVREDYFYPRKIKGKFYWERMSRESMNRENFVEPGLACLVLQKRKYIKSKSCFYNS